MRKLILFTVSVLSMSAALWADNVILPSSDTAKAPPPIVSATQTASMVNPWPSGFIYYTVPGVKINLVTPWSAAIIAYGHDYIGKSDLAQGYVPLANWWKITGIVGGGINSDKQGSPLAGGMLNILNVPLSNLAEFHVILTGGYDFNGKHAMAVLSPSVQFLK